MTPYAPLAATLALGAALPALAAPDEEFLGKADGYPLCERRFAMSQTRCFIATFSRMDEIFPTRKVAKAAERLALRRVQAEPSIRVGLFGNLDSYLGNNRTTGLLVLKGDTILVERYQYDRKPEHRMMSFSMAKTLVALMVGIALEERKIASIDDRADQYVPELRGTAYGETPIRHLLTMSSGIRFSEAHDGTGDNVTLGRASQGWQSAGGAATVAAFRTRDAAPGERYNYVSADTQVLGLVLRAATGTTMAEYLTEKIWQPMGAEAEAAWVIDRGGYETAFSSFSATLRDWGRLGMLLANGGALNGRQIVPAAWLREQTRGQARYRSSGRFDPYDGYGYQTWIIPGGGQFALSGFRGQTVYVDPKSKLVMVHTAAREHMDPNFRDQISLWHSVVDQLAAHPI
jgi:CubicO group peptidase (beta-lactamase class C family)